MSIVVIGDRRAGKTSMLMALASKSAMNLSVNDTEVVARLSDLNSGEIADTAKMNLKKLQININLPRGLKQINTYWIDIPDELFSISGRKQQLPTELQKIEQQIRESQAIMLLISPPSDLVHPSFIESKTIIDSFPSFATWRNKLKFWLNFLKNNCYGDKHIAICLHKADTFCDIQAEGIRWSDYNRITNFWYEYNSYVIQKYFTNVQDLIREYNSQSLGTLRFFITSVKQPSLLELPWIYLGIHETYETTVLPSLNDLAWRQAEALSQDLNYLLLLNVSPKIASIGLDVEVNFYLNPPLTDSSNFYILTISSNEAIGNELNIILTAPGFQFNGDNTTSLPLSDTINITQTATFNLTALRSGKSKIKVEVYCGETYKTTLETEVEVTGFDETKLRPLIAARSRPVPQPDIILQARTTWNSDISACSFNYHIDSYQPRLLFADDVDYNSQSLSTTWVERSHSLLKATLEEAATSLREDFRSRLVSLGQYLFQSLLPEELQNTFRTIASFNHPFTLLILADQDGWFPWELLHDGQKFLGDRFIIGRWLWELEKARPYEFPVGVVNVAHYASVEQPELWTELLQSSGAPPPISMQAGIFNDITLFESIRGLHLIRYGQSVDTTNRQDAPVRVNSSSDIQDIEREVQPAKLSLRRNHPLVSLSYLNAGQPELTALEQTWASTFVRAGCSAFVGSLWAVQPNVEAAFVSAFYHSIWAGQTLGVAFQTARRLAKTVVPESLDWLAYVLFGDPMARPYRPVQGQGYAVVEPIGQEIDDPVSPGSTVRFRVSLRRTPPVWYENRLMEVAEDLSFDDLRVFIVTSGLQVTPGDSILMTRTATGDYLGWFTLTAPTEMESQSVLVQVYFEDGIEPVHNLRFALNIVKQDGEAQ
jgi:GTPase SAR1 family protein